MLGRYVDLGDVGVEVECELGRKRLTLGEASRLRAGDVVELDKLCGEPDIIRVNGEPFAEGEVVVAGNTMAVRVTRMAQPPSGAGGGIGP